MYRGYNFDADLELHDGVAALTADGAGVVDSAAATRDVGGANSARFDAVCIIDISALDFTTGDETYRFKVRGSAASNMGSPAELASIDAIGATTGRIELFFTNVKQGTAYRYIDLYLDVAGNTPSATFKAFVAPIDC